MANKLWKTLFFCSCFWLLGTGYAGGGGFLPAGFVANIPPPPPDDMPEARALQSLISLRSPEALHLIHQEAEDPTFLFWALSGLRPSKNERFAHTVLMVQDDVVRVVMPLKATFSRARPSVRLAGIDPVLPVPWHAAYPSGHATQARVMAHLFSWMVPEKTDALFQLANRIGTNREVAGLHYPSDTAAGVILGDQIWTALVPQLPRHLPVK